jgi:carboxylate-amine ligase
VTSPAGTLPDWAEWNGGEPADSYTIGVEEEVMLLEPGTWRLAPAIEAVLANLGPDLVPHVTAETHNSALELATGVHGHVHSAISEIRELRRMLVRDLAPLGLQAASSGTHPFAVWTDTHVSKGERYEAVYGSVRELARREPTFAMHVHIGVAEQEDAIRLYDRMRAHLPLLLALSANSPFWQGRDTGLASARTPLFQAFPRVGIPRAFGTYAAYAETVDLLIRCNAFPESTYLWWDVRPQPRLGTIEVRICDAQTTVAQTCSLVALIQCIARLEIEEGWIDESLIDAPEALVENRFIAVRDGMEAELIVPSRGRRVSAMVLVDRLVEACGPHARDLGCEAELECVHALANEPGAKHQLNLARGTGRLPGLVAQLAADFGR